MYRMGELCRFASRFDEALAWYEQAKERYDLQRDVAGASRALRGQAAVYLDTVRPIKAESLLQEALRLIDGQQYREEQAWNRIKAGKALRRFFERFEAQSHPVKR